MLRTLRIRDLAIIEDLVVEFGPGLNLLTGETGAGKSILVDALGLGAGDRGDTGLVRSGAERAVVDAVFELPPGSPVPPLLEERGVDARDGELVVRREVAAAGGGRVFLNGAPCALAVLREVGGLLVELHGQHEHQSLLSVERHGELLDRFGGHEELAFRVGEAHRGVLAAAEERERLLAHGAEREERAQTLERKVREIDALSPRPGEHESLERERHLLKNSGRMAQLLEEVVVGLYEGDPAAASLAAASARCAAELAELDPGLEDVARRIEAARLELEDAGSALRDYRDRADFDPLRLEAVESRLAGLDGLRLRYGVDEEAVLRFREEAAKELATLGNLEVEQERCQQALADAEREYVSAATALSKARKLAARQLRPAVEEQLSALALGRARVEAAFTPARGRAVAGGPDGGVPLHVRGAERVEFLLAANPGEAPRPLAKVASGGELSRIMLALHGVLEGAGEGRVLVFDEVDAGIGGAVADALGARLAGLALRNQVLCVTHLPQVAAYANRHYHVSKRVARGRTHAEILPLSGEGRVDELARMLGGRQATEASRRNAAELLAAASGRAPGPRARA